MGRPRLRLNPRWALLALLLPALSLLHSSRASADFFSTSPGPLTQSHAAIDGTDHCQDCHIDGRALSRDKCLSCHKSILERQRDHVGVHASAKAADRPCELCHTDHKGRGKDILGWQTFSTAGKSQFDHSAYTSFPLTGGHQSLDCAKCHHQKTEGGHLTYLKAPSSCIGCHENPHGAVAEPLKKCERCHDTRSWKAKEKLEFNHARDTRFTIERKHQQATCVQCHLKQPDGRFPSAKLDIPASKDLPKLIFRIGSWKPDCAPCHENVHGKALFGQKACRLCHSADVEWRKVVFDHNRQTKFALDGAHLAKATCASCHKKDAISKPDRRCESCHSDVHAQRFEKVQGNDCAACHTANNFGRDIRFDHGVRTRFSLTGKHAEVDCRNCHRGKTPTEWENFQSLITRVSGKTKVACMGCHQHENVHQKQYPNERCLECHRQAGVAQIKSKGVAEFHGAGSKFPLVDGHKEVACIKCHPSGVFTGAPTQCGPACHPDDLHKGTLGNDCVQCHLGARWEPRKFDHDTMTPYPITGRHREVKCINCHPRRDFAAQKNQDACVNCHKKDDVHEGALGPRCERCHKDDGKVSFDHNDEHVSDWPLNGKHQDLQCQACHKDLHFKPTPRDCSGCHAEPELHKGQLGTLCQSCHVASDWKIVRTGHDIPTPRFGGAHDGLACVKCHPGGRLLGGTSQLCITCHRGDDIHHNTLGPRCGDCHTQRSFAGAHFEHTRVGCELTGVHRLLPCADCHVGGNFVALATTCAACHRAQAKIGAARGGPVGHASFGTCADCHTPYSFKPGLIGHGSFHESVCR